MRRFLASSGAGACPLSSLSAALTSSIGKKFVMGITGLFLCLFLVIHLAGNGLLFVGDGTAYNEYAHKLHSMPAFLVTSEIFLYLALAAHIYLAVKTSGINWTARGDVDYSMKRTKIYGRVLGIQPESMMFISGAAVLVFMLIHVWDFKFFEYSWGRGELEPFDRAMLILSDTWRKLLYVVGSLFVGLHVVHGLRSAFQSLGLNHPKYNQGLRYLSIAFAIVMAVGFASFPLWFTSAKPLTPQTAPADGMAADTPTPSQS
jgi:succinate dehydrogenase / fumarate reductase, cytochrome b subunit